MDLKTWPLNPGDTETAGLLYRVADEHMQTTLTIDSDMLLSAASEAKECCGP